MTTAWSFSFDSLAGRTLTPGHLRWRSAQRISGCNDRFKFFSWRGLITVSNVRSNKGLHGPRWAFQVSKRTPSTDLTDSDLGGIRAFTSNTWLSDSMSQCHNTTVHWWCAMALHGHTWQSASESPRPGFGMVFPVKTLPNRHAMAPPVCNWLPTGTNPVDRQTDTHTHMH